MTLFHTYPPRRLYEYWLSLPKEGLLPPRSAVNPADIADILPYVTILELHNREELVYRLAGTKIVERLGMEPTGRNYFDIIPAETKPRAIEIIAALVSTPCGARSMRREHYERGYNEVIEYVGLPISNPHGGPPFIISANAPTKQRGITINTGPRTTWSEPLEIVLIDIGAGVPELDVAA